MKRSRFFICTDEVAMFRYSRLSYLLRVLPVLAVLLFTVPALGEDAPKYSIYGFNSKGLEGVVLPRAINNQGHIVGYYQNAQHDWRSVVFNYKEGRLELSRMGTNIWATGINNSGVIAGWGTLGGTDVSHAFKMSALNTGRAITDLGTLSGGQNSAAGESADTFPLAGGIPPFNGNVINGNGIVCGSSMFQQGVNYKYAHACFWDATGGCRDLGTLGGYQDQSVAYGINTYSHIVGWSQLPDGNIRPFFWMDDNANGKSDPGEMRNLGNPLGGGPSWAKAINDKDQIVGAFRTHGNGTSAFHGFFFDVNSPNGMEPLPTLKGDVDKYESEALSINKAGLIVGYCGDENGRQAVIWDSNHNITRLFDLVTDKTAQDGWTSFDYALAINDDGWVIGLGVYKGIGRTPFVLVPAKYSQVASDRAHFSTKNKSIWFKGDGSFDKQVNWSVPWDFHKELGGFFSPTITIPWPDFLGGDIHLRLGETGAKATIGSKGKAGFQFRAHADTGTVAVDYPITVKLEFPPKGKIEAGQSFDVPTSVVLNPSARMSTTQYGSAGFYVNLFAQAESEARILAKLAGNNVLDVDLFDLLGIKKVDINKEVVRWEFNPTNLKPLNFDVGGLGILTGSLQFPRVESAGGIDNTHPDELVSNVSGKFLSVRGSITNAISQIFGINLAPETHDDYGVASLDTYLGLLQIYIDAQASIQHSFRFAPKPHVHLDITDEKGNTLPSVDFDAGETIKLTMPLGNPVLVITPTISLPNTFTNDFGIGFEANGDFDPFHFRATGRVAGYDLPPINWSPWNANFPLGNFNLPLLHDTITPLGGFQDLTQSSVQVLGNDISHPQLHTIFPDKVEMLVLTTNAKESDEKQRFNTAIAQTTTVFLTGIGLTQYGDIEANIEYFGHKLPLTPRWLSEESIEVDVPNYLFVLPGVARLTVTNVIGSDRYTSNSIDLAVIYPVPNLFQNTGFNLWASDPRLGKEYQVFTLSGSNFVDRDDYYWLRNPDRPKVVQPRLQRFWNDAPTWNGKLSLPAFFPAFTYFDEAKRQYAPLPTVKLDGKPLAFYIEPDPSGSLPVFIDQNYLTTAGLHKITVTNPGTEGFMSNEVIRAVFAPKPEITNAFARTSAGSKSYNPLPGESGFRLVVRGKAFLPIKPEDRGLARGFAANSVVYWNNSPRMTYFISPSEIQADITAEDIANAGSYSITVGTPSIDVDTYKPVVTFSVNTFSLAIFSVTPVIGQLNPDKAFSESPAFSKDPIRILVSGEPNPFNLIVKGNKTTGDPIVDRKTAFVRGATIYLGSIPLSTTYISDRQLAANVPESLIAKPTTYSVRVRNPGKGGGYSNIVPLVIVNDVPKIVNVFEKSVAKNTNAVIHISGTGFYSDSMVYVNGILATKSVFSRPGKLTATLPKSALSQLGSVDITVVNPSPEGGTSDKFTIQVLIGTSLSVRSVVGPAGSIVILGASLYIAPEGLAVIPGKVLTFTISIDGISFTGTTNAKGKVDRSYTIPPGTAKGTYKYTVTFAGDADYLGFAKEGYISVN